jgi:hypothetical protein
MGNVQNCDSGADNLTAIYEPIVQTMWDLQHLTTLEASYGASFYFFQFFIFIFIHYGNTEHRFCVLIHSPTTLFYMPCLLIAPPARQYRRLRWNKGLVMASLIPAVKVKWSCSQQAISRLQLVSCLQRRWATNRSKPNFRSWQTLRRHGRSVQPKDQAIMGPQ